MTDQLPPHSIEAEEAVVGSLLLDPTRIFEVQRLCQPDDLYQVKLRWIYSAIAELHETHRAIDYVTLCDLLELQGRLEAIGGPAMIPRLVNQTPTAVHAVHYARIVKDYAIKRRLIEVGGAIARTAYSADGGMAAMLTDVRRAFDAAMPKTDDAAHLTGDAALVGFLETLSLRAERWDKDPDSFLRTGWSNIDRWLSFEPGALTIVAGQAGVGKTALMECIAEHNAQRDKHVLFYHFELSHEVMLTRRMARHSGVSFYQLRRGLMPDAVHAATQRLSEWQGNIIYVHCPGWDMGRVAADIAMLDYERGVDLVVVDYLQKAALPMSRGLNQASLIGLVVEQLKNSAERLGISIILGSQVNRSRLNRAQGRPQVGDLRSSGEIEEKCNVVLLLYREELDDPQTDKKNLMEVNCGKNTFGELGHGWLRHRPGLYRFDEVEVEKQYLDF